MTTKAKQTTNYKQIFRVALLIFVGLLIRWAYLKVSNVYVEYDIARVQKKVSQKDAEFKEFATMPGYNKLQYVKTLEQQNMMMPWSDHVNAIMKIFDDLLAVDQSDAFNIQFSDFEISLERIKLNGYVTNLSILYQGSDTTKGLISRFEELDFLDKISIKTYEKIGDRPGLKKYKFTLTANVINNGK